MSVQHIALVLEASGLCAQEKAVLTAFCNHTGPDGKTHAGEERLMREAGMPRTTFQRWRSQLVKRELLISRRKGRKGGGRTTSDTWVNLEALRAARDPFFGIKPTDRPEDENPFTNGSEEGGAMAPPVGPKEGGAMAPPVGPKPGGNGPASGAVNGPASGAGAAPPVGPRILSNPQREPSSSARAHKTDRPTVAEAVTEEEETEQHDYPGQEIPAPRPAAAPADGQEAEAIRQFVAALPRAREIGRSEADRIAEGARGALHRGWTLPRLRAHLAPRCGSQVRMPGALYASLLADLPEAPGAAGTRPVRPGECSRHRGQPAEDCPICPRDAVVTSRDRVREILAEAGLS